jgi:putative ABC transport system permease protein
MTSHLKFALRHLWRKKLYTIIILLSLTVGFTCTNLLLSFLIAELNADSFHSKKDRIFQVFSDDPFSGKNKISYIPGMVQQHLTDNYPEVENACTITTVGRAVVKIEDQEFRNLNIVSADVSFFDLFDFPLATHSNNVIGRDNIILSREKAKIFFGDQDALGKVISLYSPDSTGSMVNRLLTVSAIMQATPEKSHLNFDALIDASAASRFRGGNGYILLRNSDEAKSLEEKLNQDKLRPGLTGAGIVNYHFDPLTESYFNKTNPPAFTQTKSKLFIWAGSVICFLILFMASFNFINLLLLSFQSRKKETGIKKTLGISIRNLFQATFTEVTIYLIIAYTFSIALTFATLPVFNTTLQTTLSFDYLSRLSVMSSIGLIVFLLAGIVIFISVINQWRIKPISLMQNQNSKITFNKLLFTVQFVISITMAICSITVIKQMRFIENEPLGFNRNIIELNAPDKESHAKLPLLKENLLQLPDIENATVCSGNPISGNTLVLYELDNGESYSPYVYNGDEDFFKTLELKLTEGELPSSREPDGVVVNEKLVSLFNMKHPVGETVPGMKSGKIVGVVKNFTSVSFKVDVPP